MANMITAAIGTAAGLLFGAGLMKRQGLWSVKNGVVLILGTATVFLAGGYLMSLYEYHFLKILRCWILLYGLLLLAVYDIKERIIPNKALVIMAVMRTVLLAAECISFPLLLSEIVISSLAGLAGGGGLFLLAGLVSRKGLGMGDVKMIAVTGYFLGFRVLMSSLIITMTLTLAVGTALLLARRASMKSELPFAPFAAVGTCITILAGF